MWTARSNVHFAALALLVMSVTVRGQDEASSFDCTTMLANTRGALQYVAYSPDTVRIVLSQELPSYWSSNVRGRVHPVGIFSDAEGTLEYFYALGIGDALQKSDLQASSGELVFQNITERYIYCDESSGKVVWSYVGKTGTVQDDGSITLTPQHTFPAVGVFTFDSSNKICSYDMTLERLGLFIGTTSDGSSFEAPSTLQNPINTASKDNGWLSQFFVRNVVLGRFCGNIQSMCTGTNQQYTSKRDCVSTLSGKEFGIWDNADHDTVTCRLLHSRLVPVRPDVHCKHVGPDGGEKCTDKTMADLYETDYMSCPVQ